MALYDAFVSYSHAKDKPIAAALQSAVQKLGKPWYRRRALRRRYSTPILQSSTKSFGKLLIPALYHIGT